MKKTNVFILSIFMLFLSGCLGVKDPVTSDETLYKKLGEYATLVNDFKCSSLLDVKQLTEDYLLTTSGKLYEVSFVGGLFSSTNENCAKVSELENVDIKAIIPKGYKYLFYANSSVNEIDWDNKLKVSSVDQKYLMEFLESGFDSFVTYGIDNKGTDGRVWPYLIYIESNKPYYSYSSSERLELVVVNRTDGDTLTKITRFALFSNKAVYLFSKSANLEECKKYVDVKCSEGYKKSDAATIIQNDLSAVILYFDGYYVVTKNGKTYTLK